MQAMELLRKAGFSGDALRTAYAVMMAESGGNPRAFNPNRNTGDLSYGLFQINMLGGMGPERRKMFGLSRNEDLYDPLTNARIAYRMSKGGKDWSPWSAYKNGAYRKHLKGGGKEIAFAPGAATGLGSGGGASNSGGAGLGSDPGRLALLASVLGRNRAHAYGGDSGGPSLAQSLLLARMSARGAAGAPGANGGDSGAFAADGGVRVSTKARKGALEELIHDPMGAYYVDGGKRVKGSHGGHGSHVHLALNDPRSMLQAIRYAQKMGLAVRENPFTDPVDPVHSKRSHHYQTFGGLYGGKKLGRAADISGDAAKMRAFYQWAAQMYGR